MADDQSSIPGFDDYSAAMDRLRAAKAAGQDYSPSDVDIVRRGAASHSQNYDAAQSTSTAPTVPAAQSQPWISQLGSAIRPTPAGQEQPWDWKNIIERGALSIPDWAATGYNKGILQPFENWGVINPGHQIGTASEALGIPPAPANASGWQKAVETGGPLLAAVGIPLGVAAAAGTLPEAGLAGLGTAGLLAAAKAGGSYLGGSLSAAAGAGLGEALDPQHPEKWGEPLQWWLGTAGGAAPGIAEGLYRKHFGSYRDPNAPAIQKSWTAAKETFEDVGQEVPKIMEGKYAPYRYYAQGPAGAWGADPVADADLAKRLADLAVSQRRELPDVTAGNAPVVNAAEAARKSSGLPGNMGDASSGIEAWIDQTFGNKPIDVTNTMQTLEKIKNPAGAGANPISTDPADIAGANNLINRLKLMGATQDPQTGNWSAPFKNFRGWRAAIGAKIGDEIGLGKGKGYGATYGAANNDLENAATQFNASPDAVKAALKIESNQYGADALEQQFHAKNIGDPGQKYPMAPLAKVIDPFRSTPTEYEHMFGGPYVPKGAPSPTGPGGKGPGDIRELASHIKTLGTAGGPPGPGPASIWQRLGQYAPALTGLAYGGLEHIGKTLMAATGVEALKEMIPDQIMNDPAVKAAMVAGKSPPVPWRDTIMLPAAGGYTQYQEGVVPKTRPIGAPNPYNPVAPAQAPGEQPRWKYNPVSPRSNQRLGALPTTQDILAAWNAANVGNPRSMTG
jgi:hypothetical protein